MSDWQDDRWKDSYDAWKLASPDDNRGEECNHEGAEVNYEGRSQCGQCGESWWATDHEIAWQRATNPVYDAHCRKEDRRRWWNDQWYAWVIGPTFPLRFWMMGVVWRAFPKHRRANRFISYRDEIPF